MNSINILLAFTNLSSGIILIFLSIPLYKKKIKMNKTYGFRLSKAFQSDENWFNINAYGAKQMIIWSIIMILFGIAILFIPIPEKPNTVLALTLSVGPLILAVLIVVLKTIIYAKRL
ncbi:MAG: SdpI family protein [Phycisphaerales bacterium]|jgi:hypothetical protein